MYQWRKKLVVEEKLTFCSLWDQLCFWQGLFFTVNASERRKESYRFFEQHDVFNFFVPSSTTLQVFRMDVVWTSFGTLQIYREWHFPVRPAGYTTFSFFCWQGTLRAVSCVWIWLKGRKFLLLFLLVFFFFQHNICLIKVFSSTGKSDVAIVWVFNMCQSSSQ